MRPYPILRVQDQAASSEISCMQYKRTGRWEAHIWWGFCIASPMISFKRLGTIFIETCVQGAIRVAKQERTTAASGLFPGRTARRVVSPSRDIECGFRKQASSTIMMKNVCRAYDRAALKFRPRCAKTSQMNFPGRNWSRDDFMKVSVCATGSRE